jgi:hypothetical protein
MTTHQTPINVFLSYAHEDEPWLQELETHLSSLKRQGLISTWYDRQIVPGTDRAQMIEQSLEQASIILLLVSADFMDSNYCQVEMMRALEHHEAGKARVIPIMVRPCDWRHAPFAKLKYLPRDGKAITTWGNRDLAWNDVTEGIREAIEDLHLGNVPAQPRIERLLRLLLHSVLPRSTKPSPFFAMVLILLVLILLGGGFLGIYSAATGHLPGNGSHGQPTSTPSGKSDQHNTNTPSLSPGTVLFTANWSNGLNDWRPPDVVIGRSVWSTSKGNLVCDGSQGGGLGGSLLILERQQLPTSNYAIEARIQVKAIDPNISGIYFGLLTRESSTGVGYMAGVGGDTSLENTIFENDAASEPSRTEATYNDAVGVWHTYRVEAKNNTIKLFIDGTFMFQESVQQNTFLNAGQNGVAGLACSYLHLLVGSFTVTAL